MTDLLVFHALLHAVGDDVAGELAFLERVDEVLIVEYVARALAQHLQYLLLEVVQLPSV